MSKLVKLFWWLIYLLPAVLFFSYYPVISFGSNSSMNFELSLPLIWLVIFDFVCLLCLFTTASAKGKSSEATIKKIFSRPLGGISDRRFFLFALFPFFLTLSVFWSANPLRGFLTAGVVWLLFFAIFFLLCLLPLLPAPAHWRRRTLGVFFITTSLVCLFCLLQSILDVCGLPRENTLLCAGCTYHSFGFPHPSGFAIEPQFMGNLLLAPTLTALYLLIFKDQKQHRLPLLFFAGLFSTTLFFTLSRGAIYAYALALFVLFIFALIRHQFRWSLITIPVITFLLSLGFQGLFAATGPTSETFTGAVTKSIHHLSLGLIDLRPHTASSPKLAPDSSSAPDLIEDLEHIADQDSPDSKLDHAVDDLDREAAIFEGYVAESTNIRLSLNAAAFNTALASVKNLLVGVGLGGAGTAMHALYPDQVTSPKEIVQNQAFSLFVETGAIGLFLAHFVLILIFLSPLLPWWFIDGKQGRKPSHPKSSGENFFSRQFHRLKASAFWSHPALPLLLSLVIAYAVTLSFFSGLPNALQIYLMPPLLFRLLQPSHPRRKADF